MTTIKLTKRTTIDEKGNRVNDFLRNYASDIY